MEPADRPVVRRTATVVVLLCLMVLAGAFAILRGGRPADPSVAAAPPVVPALHTNHPLDEPHVGALLIGELGCAACHPQLEPVRFHSKSAPDLTTVGSRVAPDFIRRFIADPAAVQPGTTMPQVLTGMSAQKRDDIAEAITHFLVASDDAPFNPDRSGLRNVVAGRTLYHTVGCVACHAPRQPPPDGGAVPTWLDGTTRLDHLADKYSLASLSTFLHQPQHVRPSGRMPDMALTFDEATSIASYLLDAAPPPPEPLLTDPSLVESGMQYFKEFNCAACHQHNAINASPQVVALDRLDTERGCLAPKPVHAPDFSLSDDQRIAIQAALALDALEASVDEQIAATLTTFNCIACHDRDGYGGVRAAINPYFQTTEPSLGDQARLPPPLTHTGAKLTSEWMHRVMFDGAAVRPYMLTRMPQFGESNLGPLPERFSAVDPAEPFDMAQLDTDAARESRDAGRLLLGTDGLGCVTCHNFNGKASPSFKGIDLITSIERLHPAWFAQFLVEPQALRPGIVMPVSWPGGTAQRTDILDGDTRAQLEAIWSFLALGRTARDPAGIRAEPSILSVSDTTRTYRGRSGIAGFRGIAVGFPGGLNYAFNAHTGSLAGLWQGGFIRVRWDGQGAGDFHPEGRVIALPQDVAFHRLPSDDAPWPLRPHMDDEHPVNPDPLYPRRLGYQFDGYTLDEASVPTFLYRTGTVAIQDIIKAPDSSALVRTIQFTSPAPELLQFRVLTGDIEETSPDQFQTNALRVITPPETARLRQTADVVDELLLDIEVPAGESRIVIRYELLD